MNFKDKDTVLLFKPEIIPQKQYSTFVDTCRQIHIKYLKKII